MFRKIIQFFAVLGTFCCCHGEKVKIICFGDSLTACGGKNGRYSDMLQQSMPEYHFITLCSQYGEISVGTERFINSSKNGDTIGGALARLDDAVLKHKAAYLIIGIGANDYWRRQRSLSDLKKDFEEIISCCHRAGMKIVIISCFGNEKLPDNTIIDFNKPALPFEYYAAGIAMFEQEIAAKYQAEYVPDMQCGILPKGRKDLWSDSNHPNSAGNRIVANTILPSLKKILK